MKLPIIEDLEKDRQNANELIAVFCGGVLERNPLLGEAYRFDDSKTHKVLMKVPPFGIIPRTGLSFDYDYNFLIWAIRECRDKQISPELEEKYKEIISALSDLCDVYTTNYFVVDFIKLYNETISVRLD